MTKPLWVLGIGGMKCGSTTLDADLRRYFGLNLLPKESSSLARLSESSLRTYAHRNREFSGEVSATYTMHPSVPSVAAAAASALADTHRVRILYLVRNPVDRIESHLHHDAAIGRVSADQATNWRTDDRFVSYSSYYFQYEQWAAHFAADDIFVFPFETYAADRPASLQLIGEFLGCEPTRPLTDFGIENASQGKQVVQGKARKIVEHPMYSKVRALAPSAAVRVGRRILLRSAPPRTTALDDSDRRDIVRLLEADRTGLRRVARVSAPWIEE